MPKGDCFRANGVKMMEMPNSAKLCHGEAITLSGKIHHCWIESGIKVFDFSNDMTTKLDKTKYYDLLSINPSKVKKYTGVEAMVNMMKQKHWGPWE